MSRDIDTENVDNAEDALFLLDRGRLPADLQKVVQGAPNRQVAAHKLADHFDDDVPGGFRDYDEMKVDELRAELRNRGLSDDGNKAELVERLEEDDFNGDGGGENDEG